MTKTGPDWGKIWDPVWTFKIDTKPSTGELPQSVGDHTIRISAPISALHAYIQVPVVKGDGLDTLPEYETEHAAGLDLRSTVDAEIYSGGRFLVPTGLRMAIPVGFEGQIRPRSGLALHHNVTVLNSPGTIDADFRGEVKVLLINHGPNAFVVRKGDRIAQMVFTPVIRVQWEQVDSLDETERGAGGFGSTGR